MSVGLLIITDGRGPYLQRMLMTLGATDAWSVVVVDDSGDAEYNCWLRGYLPPTWLVTLHQPRRGLTGAVACGWEEMQRLAVDYVAHIEEDFTFFDPPPVAQMIAVLEQAPGLAQVVLKRQPWSAEEIAAGGIIEAHPEDYRECSAAGLTWVEHERIFSLNPCVYPASTMAVGAEGAEAGITTRLLSEGRSFAFYGSREDQPRCEHIGARRSAQWLL